jgi:hypothetical protein
MVGGLLLVPGVVGFAQGALLSQVLKGFMPPS